MKEEISLGELIVLVLKFIKKYFILFTIAAVLGGAFGYIKESYIIPNHKSEAVICSDILDGQRLSEIISEFENATRTGNYAFLSNKLGVSLDSARNIASISIELIEPEIPYRTDVDLTKVKTHQCIRIVCSAKSPNIFAVLQSKILDEYNNHEDTKNIVELRKENYLKLIKQIKEDLDFLSDQRVKMFNQLQKNNHSIDINQFDSESQFIYSYEKITSLEELYLRTKAVILMKSFNNMTVARHSKTKGIIITVIMFLAVAGAVAVFREIKI